MSNQISRLIKPFFLMVLSLLLITACSSSITHSSSLQREPLGFTSQCRVVQHTLGESCVPVQPQRVISLEISWLLDPLLALGLKPVGTVSTYAGQREYFPGLSADEVAGIEIIGTPAGISLEKILKLKPDLILSLDSGKSIYNQLSAVAPTVVKEYEKIKYSFKDNLRSIAKLVNREEEAEEVLSQYQRKIETLRELSKD
jgi:iron complex transport system substrate-binding protein